MSLGFAITGALQVETVSPGPAWGRLMYDALKGRDYPLLQGIFLITSSLRRRREVFRGRYSSTPTSTRG